MGVWKYTVLQDPWLYSFTLACQTISHFHSPPLLKHWNLARISLHRLITKVFLGRREKKSPAFLSLNVSGLVTVSHLSLIGISTISFSFGLSGSETVRLNLFWLPLTAETHCSCSYQRIQLQLHNAVLNIYVSSLTKQEPEIWLPYGSTFLETGKNIAEMQQIYWNAYCEGGCHI